MSKHEKLKIVADNSKEFYKVYAGQKKEDFEQNKNNTLDKLETTLKEYLVAKYDNKLNETRTDKLILKMFRALSELDVVYDIFVKNRMAGLKKVASINKNIYLFDDEEFFSELFKKCLNKIEEEYRKNKEILSLIEDFNKVYYYKIQDVFLKKMKKKNVIEEVDEYRGGQIRHLIKEVIELLYKKDRSFLLKARDENKKVKGNNRQKAQDCLMNIFIKKINLAEKSNKKQGNLPLLKEASIDLINKLYPKYMDKEDECSNEKFIKEINNLEYINEQALQEIFLNINIIERNLKKIKDIFRKPYVVSNEQSGEDGKTIYLSEQEEIAELNKKEKEVAQEKLVELTDKANEILFIFKTESGDKSLISFIEASISIYILKYYNIYRDIPFEVKDFIKNELDEYEDFAKYYNTLSEDEKENEKPESIISIYLDKKYDTVRKYPKLISKKMKEQKYALRLLAITQKSYSDF